MAACGAGVLEKHYRYTNTRANTSCACHTHTSQMGGYVSAQASMCQQAARPLDGRGRAERRKEYCEGKAKPPGSRLSLRLCVSH